MSLLFRTRRLLGRLWVGALLLVAGCQDADAPVASRAERAPAPQDTTLFTRLPAAHTNVDFANTLNLTEETNVFTYRHYYNGGGVALGDVNGDGRTDIYFTHNQKKNRLYLNRGDWWFTDATEAAGVGGTRAWSTGVTMADVNGDGRLDIYVCNSGDIAGDDKQNELFINQGPDANGVPQFEEQAAQYNLDDEGYGTHASFFDYDHDGDLDVYLLNNSFTDVSKFDLRDNQRTVRDALGGDKLLRNDNGTFVDVTKAAGIYSSEIGFGLGITVGDVNRDGWPDLYISNDFFERDYLYINQQDGTFREALTEQMRHISLSSMGADMADVNNDAQPDIFVTDMLPDTDRRLKTTSVFESWNVYQMKLRNGYYHQLMRNMLHLNNGNGTFSEIGALAGVHATDWSWGALLADFDLDGLKDILVTNGIRRDLTDQDFIQYLANEETFRRLTADGDVEFMDLIKEIPETPLPNYAFRNVDGYHFAEATRAWGLGHPTFSNGVAYGDLDNDGDLDLVVNNLDQPAHIYRNDARQSTNAHYLQIALRGAPPNTHGIGASVTLRADSQTIYLEQMPARGFQSSVSPVLTAGLGAIDTLDQVTVTWPDGRTTIRRNVAANQRLVVQQAEAGGTVPTPPDAPAPTWTNVATATGLDVQHNENDFVDFNREGLLPRRVSTEGPRLAVGDINGDGRDDVFIGGAKEQPARLMVQQPTGTFVATNEALFADDALSEDAEAAFFDADGDGDQDLYVASGGYAFAPGHRALQDRLYLNAGSGQLTDATDRLPSLETSASAVAPYDYDRDGDTDLVVGGRVVPWRYGLTPRSYLLENDGTGRFTDVTEARAPALARIGMVTDAVWADLTGDARKELAVVGDWMPLTIFRASGGALRRDTTLVHDAATGWWTRVHPADLDADGDTDLLTGNFGTNMRLKAPPGHPVTMHVGDFDRNGYVEQIVSFYNDGGTYPLPLRGPLMDQLPMLKQRYVKHADYAEQTVRDLFSDRVLASVQKHTAETFETSRWMNDEGTFVRRPLPTRAQFAPVFGIATGQWTGDGRLDVLLAGNFFGMLPNIGRLDASYGTMLRSTPSGAFEALPATQSGLSLNGQVRDIAQLRIAGRGTVLAIARNDAPLLLLEPPSSLLTARTP